MGEAHPEPPSLQTPRAIAFMEEPDAVSHIQIRIVIQHEERVFGRGIIVKPNTLVLETSVRVRAGDNVRL